ncbi:hypothetical protein GCM10023238_40530 [Streptomyces heliomycini]
MLADTHGTVWALGTRDCSLQRRHQKVIEEAPAPGLPARLTEELHALAVRAARGGRLRRRGTVEFLVAGERAHFLEMNTRLQVEHPVTEAVFGLDLVADRSASPRGARWRGTPARAGTRPSEARLYAEDPAHDWAPQTGRLHRLAVPDGVRPGHRLHGRRRHRRPLTTRCSPRSSPTPPPARRRSASWPPPSTAR